MAAGVAAPASRPGLTGKSGKGGGDCAGTRRQHGRRGTRPFRARPFVEAFLQVFFELAVGQDFLELAPGGLAFLALVADTFVRTVQQPVVVRAVFGHRAQELFVQIEALVIAFGHRGLGWIVIRIQ